MKHIFIINPAAGKKDSRQRVYTMAEALKKNHNLDVECMLTKSRGHATALTRAIAETGDYVRFYACGGDGTVNEIANGIAGFPNAAMTCIPIGTGNDFLKNFGKDAEPLFLDAKNLWNGDVTPLDLIDCNGKYCLTIACTGIAARIAESVHEFGASPMLSGRGSYLASVAVNFLFHKIGRRWRVTLDDEVIEDTFALVSMCNGRYYGGGSTPVPEARMTDGVLHTVLVKNVSKARFATLFGGYSAGDYKKLPQDIIRVSTAKVVRIEDALNATRAAVEEGIVAGGGTAYVNAVPAVEKLISEVEGDEKTGVQIIVKALQEPIRQIAANAGIDGSVVLEKIKTSGKVGYGFDAYKEVYCDMISAGIVDPAKVTRSALENAASVSSMVLTTEALVADKPEPPAPAAPGAGMGDMGGMY